MGKGGFKSLKVWQKGKELAVGGCRDSVWKKHHLETDDADPPWKMVLRERRIKVIYALSPQAKGKIERPYRWLQDRIVRTCARENVSTIEQANSTASTL
jgi:hypothetical protein